MKPTQLLRHGLQLIFGLLLIALISCSTPESRIEKDPSTYSAFPAKVQNKVKEGKIDIGYTTDMVCIAWGKPDRKTESVTSKGKTEVWTYLSSRQEFDGYDYMSVPRYYRNGGPAVYYQEPVPRYRTVFYEYASAVFTNGKVVKYTQ